MDITISKNQSTEESLRNIGDKTNELKTLQRATRILRIPFFPGRQKLLEKKNDLIKFYRDRFISEILLSIKEVGHQGPVNYNPATQKLTLSFYDETWYNSFVSKTTNFDNIGYYDAYKERARRLLKEYTGFNECIGNSNDRVTSYILEIHGVNLSQEDTSDPDKIKQCMNNILDDPSFNNKIRIGREIYRHVYESGGHYNPNSSYCRGIEFLELRGLTITNNPRDFIEKAEAAANLYRFLHQKLLYFEPAYLDNLRIGYNVKLSDIASKKDLRTTTLVHAMNWDYSSPDKKNAIRNKFSELYIFRRE